MKRIPGVWVLLIVAVLMAAGCEGDIVRDVLGADHVHSFWPVYKTIYHEAVTHMEDQGYYELVMVQGTIYEDTWIPKPVTVVDREAWEEQILEREECVCGAIRQ